jgi:hypothetical protein
MLNNLPFLNNQPATPFLTNTLIESIQSLLLNRNLVYLTINFILVRDQNQLKKPLA